MTGVNGVSNTILLQAPAAPIRIGDVTAKIEEAFRRSAQVDARRINVNAREGTVILSGNVHSWAERREAERGGVGLLLVLHRWTIGSQSCRRRTSDETT